MSERERETERVREQESKRERHRWFHQLCLTLSTRPGVKELFLSELTLTKIIKANSTVTLINTFK